MTELFVWIVNRSFAASFLVLAVLVLRPFMKKAPRWASVLLWGLVALRLIVPFSLESVLSLIPSAQVVSPEIMLDPTPTIHTGIEAVNKAVNPVLQESFAPQMGDSANPLQIWLPLCALVWAMGVGAMAVYLLLSWLRLKNRVGTAVLLRENIYQSEWVTSPFVLGILRPRIYLPFALDGAEAAFVIAHEQAHIRRKDHWWKPLGYLLLMLHWFNPLMWAAYILLCRDIEVACDEKVIQALDIRERADYSQALLRCSVNRRSIAACPLAFGEVGVKQRVKSVLSYKKPAFWIILAAVLLCIATGIFFLTDPVERAGIDVSALAGNRYQGGRLLMQSAGLSFVPEDGSDYRNIRIGSDGLELYVEFSGEQEYPCCTTLSLSRDELIRELNDELIWPEGEQTLQSVIPQCSKVDILMYFAVDGDSTPAYSLYFFDGEPVWFAERKNLRIYALELTASGQSTDAMTLADVLELAGKEKITAEDLAPFHAEQIGSGLYITEYSIDEGYSLLGYGDAAREDPAALRLTFWETEDSIDITGGGVKAFLEAHRTAYMQTMISHAIMERFAPSQEDGRLHVESHVIIGQERYSNLHTVYLLALYQTYSTLDGVLEEESGSCVPLALNFSVDEAGQYRLTNFWEPRDGSYYDDDIKARFPENAEKAALNQQNYIEALEQECRQKALSLLASGGSLTARIEALLESIMSSPLEQSNPGAYIEAHRTEFDRLVSFGEYTLRYCFGRFLAGGETGLDGHIMAQTCKQIMLGWGEAMVVDGNVMTGQEWFDLFYRNAKSLEAQYSREELEKHYPGSALLLSVAENAAWD